MRRSLILAAFLLLAACESAPTPSPQQAQVPTQPLKLDVMQVTVANEVQGGDGPKGITPTLSQAIVDYARSRFTAQGGEGTAQLVIKEASAQEEALPKPEGIDGWFQRSQDKKWEGKVSVEMTVQQPGKNYSGFASAYATRSTTIPEDATMAEKQAAWQRVVNNIMRDLDKQLDANMRQHLSSVIMP